MPVLQGIALRIWTQTLKFKNNTKLSLKVFTSTSQKSSRVPLYTQDFIPNFQKNVIKIIAKVDYSTFGVSHVKIFSRMFLQDIILY